MEMKPGIYMEIKEVSGAGSIGWHAYLVHRKKDGATEVLRGGPGGWTGLVKSVVGGDIQVETGKSLEESKDAYGKGETPKSRFARRLDIPEGKEDGTWNVMKNEVEGIGKAKVDYNASGKFEGRAQNSNSVINAALKAVNIPVKQAIHPEFKEELTGIENNLSDTSEQTLLDEFGDKASDKLDAYKKALKAVVDKQLGKEAEGAPDAAPGAENPESGEPRAELSAANSATAASSNPEVGKFLDALRKPMDAADTILAKPVERVSESEISRAMGSDAFWQSADPRYGQVQNRVSAWHDHFYGTGPLQRDATGRQIEARPQRALPKEDGSTPDSVAGALGSGVLKVGEKVASEAGKSGLANAIRILQGGLNRLPRTLPSTIPTTLPREKRRKDMPGPFAEEQPSVFDSDPLEEDGLFGPLTRARLFETVSAFGPERVARNFARPPLGHSIGGIGARPSSIRNPFPRSPFGGGLLG
ncbi:MAG: hypothetical protein ISR48_01240 [Alphaproteobacteria bacterium]|nr:hypothetical protein [Alphaproteobacteria bacterium]